MFALTLLLSAAAGVNAILGGEVSAVQISEDSFICADDCVHEGVYFAQRGYWCPEKEIIVRVDAKGNDDHWFPFDCTGAKLPNGYRERQRSNGDKPAPKCDVMKSIDTEPNLCASNKSGGGKAGKTVQWSEVEKELKLVTSEGGQATPEKNKPARQKSQQQCAEIGRQKFSECRQNSGEFDECDKQGREAIENCLLGQ